MERIFGFDPPCLGTLQGLEVPQATSYHPGMEPSPQPTCPLLGCLARSHLPGHLLRGGRGPMPREAISQMPKLAPSTSMTPVPGRRVSRP